VNGAPMRLSARSMVDAALDGPGAVPVAATVVLASAYIQFTSLIHHDVAWFLYSVNAFFEGGRLYQDIFFEVNPPLALYLTIPPAYVSRLTGWFAPQVFVAYVFGLIAISLWLVRHLLARHVGYSGSLRRGVLFSALLALAICPAGNFGQREHLMMILALPYMVLAALRAREGTCPPFIAAALGVMAALGFALKPYFLLLPVALELYLLLAGRRLTGVLRPETFGLAGAGLLYGLAIAWFTPDYLTRVVPFALEVFHQGFMSSPAKALGRVELLVLPVVLILHMATRRTLAAKALADVFALAVACLFLAYLMQMKGWSYQLFPTTASMVLALGVILFGGREPAAKPPPAGAPGYMNRAVAPIAAIALLTLASAGILRGGYQSIYVEHLTPVVRKHAAGSAIYIFTSNVSAAFPLVNVAGVRWASRFPMQWLLPGLVRRRAELAQQGVAVEPEGLREIRRYAVDSVVADLIRWSPALVFVDVREDKSYFGGLQFDYIAYFSEDPRFAQIWSRYELLLDFGTYHLYRRRPASH
jgi:hypothetical protein